MPPVMKTAPITKVTDQDGARLAKLPPRKGYEVHGITRRAGLINTYRVEHLLTKRYEEPDDECCSRVG